MRPNKWPRPWVFRMTLCHSRHGYEEAVWDQKLESFLALHERTVRDLGGVPRVVRHDNLKAAVVRACLYDPDVNPEHMGAPGAVWMVDYRAVRVHHPQALKAVLRREYAVGLDVSMLGEVFPTLDELDACRKPPIGLFFEPPSIDARVANQAGVHSVLSDPTLRMDDWLESCDVRTVKLVISPGLDGLSQWLRRYYSPGARLSEQAKP